MDTRFVFKNMAFGTIKYVIYVVYLWHLRWLSMALTGWQVVRVCPECDALLVCLYLVGRSLHDEVSAYAVFKEKKRHWCSKLHLGVGVENFVLVFFRRKFI